MSGLIVISGPHCSGKPDQANATAHAQTRARGNVEGRSADEQGAALKPLRLEGDDRIDEDLARRQYFFCGTLEGRASHAAR
jgi:hypothetical protein